MLLLMVFFWVSGFHFLRGSYSCLIICSFLSIVGIAYYFCCIKFTSCKVVKSIEALRSEYWCFILLPLYTLDWIFLVCSVSTYLQVFCYRNLLITMWN
jgi:hypothetical protein